MPDPSLLLGAAIFASGLLAGRFWPVRRRARPPKPAKPICGCEHELSFHDPKSGECHALMKVPSTMTRDSYHTGCTCKQYTGARIIDPGYVAREITDA
jgi:hypothetical protein